MLPKHEWTEQSLRFYLTYWSHDIDIDPITAEYLNLISLTCQVTEEEEYDSVGSSGTSEGQPGHHTDTAAGQLTDDSGIDSITVSPTTEDTGVLSTLLEMEEDTGEWHLIIPLHYVIISITKAVIIL